MGAHKVCNQCVLSRLDEIRATQARIETKLDALLALENKQMADLTALTAEVERNTSVEKSALTLIQGFAAQLAAAGTDPVKLQALQDQLKSNDDELAAAVAANTPATS